MHVHTAKWIGLFLVSWRFAQNKFHTKLVLRSVNNCLLTNVCRFYPEFSDKLGLDDLNLPSLSKLSTPLDPPEVANMQWCACSAICHVASAGEPVSERRTLRLLLCTAVCTLLQPPPRPLADRRSSFRA